MRSLAHEVWEIHDDLRSAAIQGERLKSRSAKFATDVMVHAIHRQLRRLRRLSERAENLEGIPNRKLPAPRKMRGGFRVGGRMKKGNK
jgi:hypothetical protein